MNRFSKASHRPWFKQFALPALVFAGIVGFFFSSFHSVSQTAKTEQLKSIRQAVTRSAIQCYSVEGFYPPSLRYLEENYGLQLDKQHYMIDYQCFAANIMPDITVIPK